MRRHLAEWFLEVVEILKGVLARDRILFLILLLLVIGNGDGNGWLLEEAAGRENFAGGGLLRRGLFR
jgi:hypothetical protein